MEKSGHYWDGCCWTPFVCTSIIYMYSTLTHWIKIDLCIRNMKTGHYSVGTTLKESKDLHCDPRVEAEKHIYFLTACLFRKSHIFADCRWNSGPGRGQNGEKKNGFNYRKKRPVRMVVTIAETTQLIFLLYVFLIFIKKKNKKEHFALLILVHGF